MNLVWPPEVDIDHFLKVKRYPFLYRPFKKMHTVPHSWKVPVFVIHLFPNQWIIFSIHTFSIFHLFSIVCVHHSGSVPSGATLCLGPDLSLSQPVDHVSRGRVSADLDTVWVVSAHWCRGQTSPRLPCSPSASELPTQPTPTTLPPGTLASVPASQAQCLPLSLSSELTH